LKNETEYHAVGGKMLKMNAKAHNMQRAVQSSAWTSQAQYTNSSKMGMIKNFNNNNNNDDEEEQDSS